MTETEAIRSRGGAAPFGYCWRDGRLEIDQKEAPVRRLIYDLFLKHRRKKTVAGILNELGYRTRSGANFSDMAVDRLLRDSTAMGRRNEGSMIVPVDPIVSIEVWERVSRLLGSRDGKRATSLFGRRVRCACGGAMSVPSKSKKYVCAECGSRILADDLEDIFIAQTGAFVFAGQRLADRWGSLSGRDKGLIVEHLCEDILIGDDTISIRFTSNPASSRDTAIADTWPSDESAASLPLIAVDESLLEEPLLSESEAAHILGISKMTLHRKRKAGQIGFFQVGFRVVYSKAKHLLPYLSGCERNSSC